MQLLFKYHDSWPVPCRTATLTRASFCKRSEINWNDCQNAFSEDSGAQLLKKKYSKIGAKLWKSAPKNGYPLSHFDFEFFGLKLKLEKLSSCGQKSKIRQRLVSELFEVQNWQKKDESDFDFFFLAQIEGWEILSFGWPGLLTTMWAGNTFHFLSCGPTFCRVHGSGQGAIFWKLAPISSPWFTRIFYLLKMNFDAENNQKLWSHFGSARHRSWSWLWKVYWKQFCQNEYREKIKLILNCQAQDFPSEKCRLFNKSTQRNNRNCKI